MRRFRPARRVARNFSAKTDQAARREALLTEIATREAASGLDLPGWIGALPDPDTILRKRGDDAGILEELASDDQATMAMTQRKLGTLLRENYRLKPGAQSGQEPTPEAKRLCDDLSRDLENLDIYNLISEVLEAPYYGLTVAEHLWEPEGGRLRLVGLKAKPREWFGYSQAGNELLFRAQGGWEAVPEHKFTVARHFPTYKNPYGIRLLSRCLWPISFKRGGIQFWMKFSERFGIPWTVGTAPSGSTREQRRAMASDLAQMVQDAVVVLPQGSEVKIAEIQGKGLIHDRLVRYFDACISKVLMGQTLTAELNDGGSLAAAETHSGILDDYRKADAQMVKTFFEDLAWSYCRVNAAPDVLTPTWEWVDDEDEQARVEQDKRLHDVGVRFTPVYFQRKYGLAEDEFTVSQPSPPGPLSQGEMGRLDGGNFSSRVQKVRDETGSQVETLEAAANPGMSAMIDRIKALVDQAESLEELRDGILEAWPDLDGSELVDVMAEAMAAAHLAGRYEILEGL